MTRHAKHLPRERLPLPIAATHESLRAVAQNCPCRRLGSPLERLLSRSVKILTNIVGCHLYLYLYLFTENQKTLTIYIIFFRDHPKYLSAI